MLNLSQYISERVFFIQEEMAKNKFKALQNQLILEKYREYVSLAFPEEHKILLVLRNYQGRIHQKPYSVSRKILRERIDQIVKKYKNEKSRNNQRKGS